MLKEPIKKTKKSTQLCILFRATKCRSIPVLQHYFLYKNQIFIYTASILDTCYINFFLIQQKRKVIKHQSTPGLRNSSCHSTWSWKWGFQWEARLLRGEELDNFQNWSLAEQKHSLLKTILLPVGAWTNNISEVKLS